MNIVFFGSPGAGKGTQATLIAKTHNLHHLSSGELSRQMTKNKDVGKTIQEYLVKGCLIPNEIIIDIVESYVLKNKDSEGFIFDGYPRNLVQAEALDALAKKEHTTINLVINLQLNEEEALKRILNRGKYSGRADDNLKTIKNRLKIYKKETEPLLNYYKNQNKLISIDASKTIKQITKDISNILNSIKNKEL